jgi:hypothetical protein
LAPQGCDRIRNPRRVSEWIFDLDFVVHWGVVRMDCVPMLSLVETRLRELP